MPGLGWENTKKTIGNAFENPVAANQLFAAGRGKPQSPAGPRLCAKRLPAIETRRAVGIRRNRSAIAMTEVDTKPPCGVPAESTHPCAVIRFVPTLGPSSCSVSASHTWRNQEAPKPKDRQATVRQLMPTSMERGTS